MCEPGLCMSVDVTSSLGGMCAWVSADLGGSHRDVKSGDVMGRKAPHGRAAHEPDKATLSEAGFDVCRQACVYKLIFFFFGHAVLTVCVGFEKNLNACASDVGDLL